MKITDMQYLCATIGNLSGIPIRLYENQKLIYSASVSALPKDPICVYFDDIMKIKDHVGYFVTKYFFYYGIVNSENTKIVIGPSRQFVATDSEIRDLAFKMDVSGDDIEEFLIGMKSIIPMPLESILQTLCAMNFVANGEKLTLNDICLYDSKHENMEKLFQNDSNMNAIEFAKDQEENIRHNSYFIEETITHIVRNGDMAALNEFLKNAPSVRSGKVAHNQLRQLKNIFIVTATLSSRAAIRGGLDVDEALSMSDKFIQHCELLDDVMDINALQYTMVHDYTEKVQRIRVGSSPTKLVTDVANYVQHHISEPISTEEMAKSLFLSRSRLSTKFKEQSGETLTDFILKEKVMEAKRLLRYSDKSIPAISSHLGFSSQSHFSRVFKKYTELTPKEYYDQHKH